MVTVNQIDGGVCAAKGFMAGAVRVGIKSSPANMPQNADADSLSDSFSEKKDLAIIYCANKCNAAALFTQNKVKAAPITISQNHIANGVAQAIIVNSGNANACTPDGMEVAIGMCKTTASNLGITPDDVIVASTGVIGQRLKLAPIECGVERLAKELSMTSAGSTNTAEAIMTTDTFPKECAVEFFIGDKRCAIGGITKGSGMIHPNMATMLSFITTDVVINSRLLEKALRNANEQTFNMISVDGDTSTNDMVCIMASGLAGNAEITDENSDEFKNFSFLLYSVMRSLARDIARDGEGATKLISCNVTGAGSFLTARNVSKSVISSNLVKTALSAADANWGRILCAIGYADGEFDISKVDVALSSDKGTITVCKDGAALKFSEVNASEILSADEITVNINLKSGNESATAYGCDLTSEYVKINAEYRT
ncbi:MAG: bifunctional glutamate N-acetyltransferase/amino-acid acetyltransferase ArgJ [Oscillospiraceae bacterium]|nr:bifunctional glutamate N-acetyltransferase/amino-acid acetyltransferase ArgJ [Oscillospiraceae bacterium]